MQCGRLAAVSPRRTADAAFYDHKVEDEAEQRRIALLGGFTMRNRICVLAISRSFGDHAFEVRDCGATSQVSGVYWV